MYSRGLARHLGETRSGCITKPKHQAMIAHSSLPNKDNFLRFVAAMAFDFSKIGCLSGQKYGESLGGPVSVCSFEKALSGGQLIEFGNPVRPVMN